MGDGSTLGFGQPLEQLVGTRAGAISEEVELGETCRGIRVGHQAGGRTKAGLTATQRNRLPCRVGAAERD